MKKIIGASLLVFLPSLVGAQQLNFTDASTGLQSIAQFINALVPVVIGIAVLLFLIGLVSYVTAGGDEEKKENARSMIIYGIVVLFVMVAVWGFVGILTRTFFGNGQGAATAPFYPAAIGR